MQIGAVLKPKKGSRMKRKEKDADEELDRSAEVNDFASLRSHVYSSCR